MNLRRRRAGGLKGEAGSELVELALTLPLLLFVLLAIADFGFLFQKQEIVVNAAREGARLSAQPNGNPTDVQNRVLAYVQDSGLDTAAGNPTITITPTTLDSGGQSWNATKVDVFYFHDYTFLAPIADWFGGAFSSVTLNGRTTMRIETSN